MSGKAWVIEQGSYSDYRVVGVFSSKANALLVADAINKGGDYNEATVAEWDLDPAVDHLNAGRQVFLVCMAYDGTVERVEPYLVSGYDVDGSLSVWPRKEAPAYYAGKNIQNAINGTVWATDEQHAVKIANEKRVQWIAEGRLKP